MTEYNTGSTLCTHGKVKSKVMSICIALHHELLSNALRWPVIARKGITHHPPKHSYTKRSTPGIAEFAGLEFAGLENDGLENDGLKMTDWKMTE